MKYLFLLEFFFFIFISITATDSHTGQRWATREGGGNIQYLHMFFRGQWGLHLKTEQSLCSETTLTDVCCSGWSVFYGAGFRPIVCQWTHVTPVSFAALNHWQGGSSAKQTSAQHKRRMIFVLFCFHGTHGFATARCLWLNAWVFFMMVCDFAECMFVRLKKNKGDIMLKWCFSVKLGNLMTHLPKTSPSEYLIWPLHFASVCLM